MGTHEGNGTSDDQPVYHHHPDNHHHPILIVNSFGAMAAANGTPQVGTTQAHGQVSPVLGSPTRTGKAAFARNLHDMDYTVSGSTDLAGEPKESVGHQRGSDKAPMTERFELGAVLGQYVDLE